GEEELVLETGKMAKQANGAVFGRLGGSAVIATACAAENEKEDLDFIPLSVDYIEKYYAAGKIPGGFIKREGRPKDKEILVSRLIDRPIRPLFSRLFRREIQVIPMAISTDLVNPPDILAMNAASAAITISDIPFAGPIGAVRMGYVDNRLIVNPTFDQIQETKLELVVAGTSKGITMVEGGARQVSESLIIEAIEMAHRTIMELCRIQLELAQKAGKQKLPLVERPSTFTLGSEVRSWSMPKLQEANFVKGKENRSRAIKAVRTECIEHFKDRLAETDIKPVKLLFEDMEQEIMRESIANRGIRTDGRTPTQIRPITCEIDLLPRTHGSALFTRGETQALVVTTLGTALDEQIMDNIDGDSRKGFMLHYNFPPFSVGEVGRLGSPGRREIGHGHLAERAISNVLPPKENFPYTVRIVSEILESNGSSSMATVCGSTLSLLNAGVRILKPVAGIAMGLVKEGEKFVVLSDILGEEDHLGDMDFKVAGTEDGITALQMDIKIEGVNAEILTKALGQAREGRLHILGIMNRTISEPRADISDFAPKVISVKVPTEKIGLIIGPGGKNIKGMSEKTGSQINIDDDGTVTIYNRVKEGAEKAQKMVEAMIEEAVVGKTYTGPVKRIMDFGAFVEILPGKEGLVHISKLAATRVENVNDVVKEGDVLTVTVTEIDHMGRINLATKEALEANPGLMTERAERRPPRRDGDRPRGGYRDGPRRDGPRYDGPRHDGPRGGHDGPRSDRHPGGYSDRPRRGDGPRGDGPRRDGPPGGHDSPQGGFEE
ncbi:MAG TPA: polyribonucleotide nucleotidyltransferase, partial [Spirochaetia bacterium]|nr:polyribonucleotide nucleotidyltransferase [Spirochaetia bacterium]